MARPGSLLSNPQDSSYGGGHAPTWAVWAALVAVYLVWGSTYLAIRVTVRTIPPFFAASSRFLIAGALLYAWSIRRGDRQGDRPTLRQWGAAAIIGGALLAGGNGMVSLAETTIPSGIASLLVATVPLWMVLIGGLLLRDRLSWRELVGLGIGFSGVLLLIGPSAGGHVDAGGVAAVLFAAVSWASGSLYARRAPLPARPLVGTAMQMLAGGVLLALAGLAAGEASDLHLSEVSGQSLLGLGYLITFGSFVGFVSYAWLLRVARTSLVSTYAYVNPVVAVFLGWAILSEEVTVQTILAGLVIVAAVALIVSARAQTSAAEEGELEGGHAEPAPATAPPAEGSPGG